MTEAIRSAVSGSRGKRLYVVEASPRAIASPAFVKNSWYHSRPLSHFCEKNCGSFGRLMNTCGCRSRWTQSDVVPAFIASITMKVGNIARSSLRIGSSADRDLDVVEFTGELVLAVVHERGVVLVSNRHECRVRQRAEA